MTAVSIAANVSRSTLFANNEASSGSDHPRRSFTVIASPLMAFMAAARGTAKVGHASSSAAKAASRTAASGWEARPRTALIGSVSRLPSGHETWATSCEVKSLCSRFHAPDPVTRSSAYTDSSAGVIWCSARTLARCRAYAWSAPAGTSASSVAPSAATHAVNRAESWRRAASWRSSSDRRAWASAERLSVVTKLRTKASNRSMASVTSFVACRTSANAASSVGDGRCGATSATP